MNAMPLTHATDRGPACSCCGGTTYGYHVADYTLSADPEMRTTITALCATCHVARTWDARGSYRDAPIADVRAAHAARVLP